MEQQKQETLISLAVRGKHRREQQTLIATSAIAIQHFLAQNTDAKVLGIHVKY